MPLGLRLPQTEQLSLHGESRHAEDLGNSVFFQEPPDRRWSSLLEKTSPSPPEITYAKARCPTPHRLLWGHP